MPRSVDMLAERIAAIRDFNRFYVPRMGFLNRKWTNMMSLTEARVIHEIYIRPSITASDIVRLIAIDGGYLSRVLRKFERTGYITRKKVAYDGRQRQLAITPKGRKAYDVWSKIAQENVESVLRNMDDATQLEMMDALHRVKTLITQADEKAEGDLRLITAGL